MNIEAATITEISESSNRVWELLVMVENDEDIPSAEIRALSESDRRIFTEEIIFMQAMARRP
jgi:hypothetical protein